MKRTILYLHEGVAEPLIIDSLSSRYTVRLCRVDEKDGLEQKNWDLIILQKTGDSQTNIAFFRPFRRFPKLFISTRQDVEGYFAPVPNLFGAVNLSGGA